VTATTGMEAKLPNRQSIRMKGWDYSTPGNYFVTCNTHGSRPLFGTIVNGCVVLNEAGRIAQGCWQEIPKHFAEARCDEFVIMPNHMHGILHLARGPASAEPHTLGDVVGAYKAAVSRMIGRRGRQLPTRTRQLPAPERIAAGASAIWHRNYWDVIVRNAKALSNIRSYIRFNPQNYHAVMQGGEPRYLGNRALLKLPKLSFLASRGASERHGKLPLRSQEAVISGFLSPMERAVFKAGLENKRSMIWVKPWGLSEGTDALLVRLAIEEGRLLVVSPFDDGLEAPSVRRAAWCNQYVLAHGDRVVVGHLNPDGMLACVLSEVDPDQEIVYL